VRGFVVVLAAAAVLSGVTLASGSAADRGRPAKLKSDRGLIILDGRPASERVTISPTRPKQGIVVSDSIGLVTQGSRCKLRSLTTAVCHSVDQLLVSVRQGNDRVEMTKRVHLVLAFLRGGDGNDDLSAPSPTSLILDGALGNDRLRGGPLGDQLTGGHGRDHFYAGRGSDNVTAEDGPHDRDAVIACGKGIDHANADKVDPKPRSCEHHLQPI
jgi:Ca2+-binding RTX toxin-like protein